MRVYSFSEARQKLAEVLDFARKEDVMIRRRSGEAFVLTFKQPEKSPFDIPGIDRGQVTTDDIVEAVRHSRAQPWKKRSRSGAS